MLKHRVNGHSQWVKSIDLNRDTIVSGSYDGKIKVWDRHNIARYEGQGFPEVRVRVRARVRVKVLVEAA